MQPNKYLYFNPFRIGSVSFELVFDDVLKILNLEPNSKVTILTCNGFLKNCSTNIEGSKLKCSLCSMSSNHLFKKYKHQRIKIIDLGKFSHKKIENEFNYNSLDDIKKIDYKGVNIGMGVVSSLVSYTRNLELNFNKTSQHIINNLIFSNCKLIESLNNLGLDYKDYKIKVFNGRFSELRTFFNYFRGKVNTLEFVYTKTKNEIKRVEFSNSLPHSIEENTKKILLNWNSKDEIIRETLSKDFFESKLNNTAFNDTNYTKNQVKNALPEKFDDSKINISYFVSSEDEVYAIGGRWDEDKLFEKQIDFLSFWITNFKNMDNYHLYVRMHPNLKGLAFDYVKDYYNYNLDNISVIEPSSKVSSYKLMFESNIVIVSSSSIGFEANYFDKPVIQIGANFYSDLEITHKPKNLNDLKKMILNKNLKSNNKIDSMKMALYLTCPPFEEFQVLNSIFGINKFFGYNIRYSLNYPKYYKILNVLFRVFSLKSFLFKIKIKKFI